jgi:hypothetical protein
MTDSFYARDGALYLPQPACRGPWNPQSLHGRVVIGILGFAIEQEHGDPAYLPARLTVDMYRMPDFSPIEIRTRVVRESRRIRVIDAELFSGGVSTARASCQMLLRTENPPGAIWSPPPWDAAHPDTLSADPRLNLNRMWEVRPIVGGFGTAAPKQTWMREVRDLVDGVPLTPFTRVAVAADYVSPFANIGDQGIGYINTDLTLYLHRLPRADWIGFEVTSHQSAEGVGVGECRLHDVEGPIGLGVVAALAQQRRA